MFIIFRNDLEERLINTDKITAIWQDSENQRPSFRVEYFGGWFRFNSLCLDGFCREVASLGDVWFSLSAFEKINNGEAK